MQFGLNFFPCVDPKDRSAEQYFRESLHLIGLSDELGYTHIRQVEHYFKPYGGYSPNPLLFLTAASQHTKKARMITGAVLPAFNNPLKLAGEIGMLDGISGGRLEVGFARAFLLGHGVPCLQSQRAILRDKPAASAHGRGRVIRP